MRSRKFTKAEWLVIAVFAVVVCAVLFPTPHARQTFSQSYHLCSNRHIVIRNYRWWRRQSEEVAAVIGSEFVVPDDHVHDWWQYSATYRSGIKSWASDSSSRYRDGRMSWTSQTIVQAE